MKSDCLMKLKKVFAFNKKRLSIKIYSEKAQNISEEFNKKWAYTYIHHSDKKINY